MSASVLVAMSGGVDSSVAAALLVDAGYDVVGITMKMIGDRAGSSSGGSGSGSGGSGSGSGGSGSGSGGSGSGCCTADDADDARAVAALLGIAHYVLDLSGPFGEHVVNRFVNEYAAGRTPNPCVECNRHIKFTELATRADMLGIDFVATGHHARLADGKLYRGHDGVKDQSYVLACVPPMLLARLRLPIGELTKSEVRMFATQLGLRTANKPESMEVCFVGSGVGGKNRFLHSHLDLRPGPVVAADGTVLGRHDGAALYTVGQRRGIGVAAAQRLYVHEVDVPANQVVVGEDVPTCISLVASGMSWLGEPPPALALAPDGTEITVQTSAHGKPEPVETSFLGDTIHVRYREPVAAPAPGQLAAFYVGDLVLGAATIDSTSCR